MKHHVRLGFCLSQDTTDWVQRGKSMCPIHAPQMVIIILNENMLLLCCLLDEVKKISSVFLQAGDYQSIFNGTFAKLILRLDDDYKKGELLCNK